MDLNFNKKEDYNRFLVSELKKKLSKVALGGGKEKIKKQHEKGKLSVRERIAYLLDNDREALEIGALAGLGMYEKEGGCPSGGVVVKIGEIAKRLCIVVANDATVKSGSWFPITVKKNLRAQEIAMENRIPIIYLVDSSGVFLPMQGDIFPDKEHFGKVFRNNAKISSMGITQISAVMGSCVAGGAYLPIMSDEVIIVNKTASIFLGGSFLVKAAIGEVIDNETLGGATTHSEISGVTDYKVQNDKEALNKIKAIISKTGAEKKAQFNRIESSLPKQNPENIYGILPIKRTEPYDMRKIVRCLVDDSIFEEYKKEYGKTILTGYARIDGWAVGIVANQRDIIRPKKGEVQFGGVIYSDSADKSTRFIANCNQKKIPLVFLHDVTGFMVGKKSEHGGIIKDGAKMINAVSNSVVPKFSIVIGNSYGAGNYAMCGRAFDPRLMMSWVSGQMAVMGGEQASSVMLQTKAKSISKKGEKDLLNTIKENYKAQSSPYYAAARLWVDGIIDPLESRKIISMGIKMADNAPIKSPFNMGILQV
ncbi:methylcrotonoyl-CoA carboxylase [Elysia marginata]|uniref:methylcrotonoyl-CoA carboxylase n=1 Tax=Elysia marginata TaxID=1093978 RepID=A0AAV4H0P0_9GAST|nr:methylcrotonoyl-CoA carboxylase [Elysia marginata]